MSIADELEKLANLRDSDVLTEGEFQVQKAKILGKNKPPIIEVASKNDSPSKETKKLKREVQHMSGAKLFFIIIAGLIPFFILLNIIGNFFYTREKVAANFLPQLEVITPELNKWLDFKECNPYRAGDYVAASAIKCVLTSKDGWRIPNHALVAIGYDNNGNKISSTPFPNEVINPGDSFKGEVYFHYPINEIAKVEISIRSYDGVDKMP
jgi:hypothetical protein